MSKIKSDQVYLWRGIANGLNVECSKLNDSERGMHNVFTQSNTSLNTRMIYSK